ncbi:MAG TPA: LPXTG cell wall anchor domain-containing protein [Bacteroidota bacterium]|nr:LPXTG cell wall anchor domain-containing protein [Bacteroidota bacterium]
MNRLIPLALLCAALCAAGKAQRSDYALKADFEERYRHIAARLDSASQTEEIDSLRGEIGTLEKEYAPHHEFLDKALYPLTFSESIARLRSLQVLTYDRVYLIRTQGVKLSELEARITSLTTRLDSLTAQRDQLFGELQESRKSLSTLREAVKRLTANLAAKDRLIFALVDTIFLPYGKDLHQVADAQKEAIGQRLEKANVLSRVYEIAADNVKFLDVTQLQGKDYGNLIEQYEAFNGRWTALKGKMTDVAATSAPLPTGTTGTGSSKTPVVRGGPREVRGATETAAAQAAHVDSVLAEWHAKLKSGFWGGLQKEFTQAGISVAPFNDGPSFSSSIRSYVSSLASSKQDPQPFVETLWRQKIDRDWREGLSRDAMLGKAEYASLDRLVGELSRDTIDTTFILYIAGILLIVAAIWFFLFRKKKEPPKPEAAA